MITPFSIFLVILSFAIMIYIGTAAILIEMISELISLANKTIAAGDSKMKRYRPAAEGYNEWASRHDFQWTDDFATIYEVNMLKLYLAIWKHIDGDTFMYTAYLSKVPIIGFVTLFDNEDVTVTTINRMGLRNLMPRPEGMHIQHLSTKSLDKLWAAHKDALDEVAFKTRMQPRGTDKPAKDIFVDLVVRQMEYISGHRLWQYRAPGWLYKGAWCNRNRGIEIHHRKL